MLKTLAEEPAGLEATGERASSCSFLDSRAIVPVLFGGWLLFGVALLSAGPFLSTHETINAQIARQSLQDGNWIVPHYLDSPFLVKPPLSPWLAAAAGWILPPDGMTGLPVSTAAARLPSVLATLSTMLVIYALARSMYGRRIALCTAFVYATFAGTMAFALNATGEALLTFFCAWAYAEFWWSREAAGRSRRIHQVLFFVAFALGMFTKAPMPLIVVAVPLAGWWFTERPVRLLADGGPRALGDAVRLFGRGLLGRARFAATDLGLWWGIPVAMSLLFAWLWAVSWYEPHIWQLWHTEYVDRLHDEKLWGEVHGEFYYLPILLGLAVPWLLSLPEAFAGPFLRRYRRFRRPILYAWVWAAVSFLVLSIMHFKQDYYLLPLMPACALLLGPVLHALFIAPSPPPSRAVVRTVVALVLFVVVASGATCLIALRSENQGWHFGDSAGPFVVVAVLFVVGVVSAARLFLVGRKPGAFLTVGLAAAALFAWIWVVTGATGQQLREHAELANRLHQAGIGDGEEVYWADSVPDGRVPFYFNRRIRQIVDPFEFRAGLRGEDTTSVMLQMASKVCKMLEGERVYFVFDRGRYSLLRSISSPKARVVFEVDCDPPGRDEHDWLVVTNE